MNSILYSDEYMEKKYINNGNLDVYSSFDLSFSSNIIGACFASCFAWLINKLINYSYIFDLIHNEVKNKKNIL